MTPARAPFGRLPKWLRTSWLSTQVIAIVGLVMVLDFASNAYVFHEAGAFTLPHAEAEALASGLDSASNTIGTAPEPVRLELARRLSTPQLRLAWQRGAEAPATGLALYGVWRQLLRERPSLGGTDLRLHHAVFDMTGGLRGDLTLRDGTHLQFSARTRSAWPLLVSQLLNLFLPTAAFAPLAGLLVYLSLRPLRELVRATRRIATPRFRVMEERGPDEVRRLIRAFNTMQTRIDELFEANVQTMLAIGHDLRTPLARLQLRLETHALDGPERQAIEADIEEMRDLLASLQTYLEADSPPGTGERVDLAAMAQTQVDQAVDCGRDADYTGPDRLPVLTNAVALRRALANLIDNALTYGGSARVTLGVGKAGIELAVEDSGPGIAEDMLPRVLQPFVRLDAARERNSRGMGLGLTIVERSIRALGGTLILANRREGGLRAAILLPASALARK
ncbi:periplasmic sensor signal transduction histidine kinase [Novosphingobium nitrogenifigens DSM 19370]|uniref:histidine kinase n=1 Tax=Novosphingobium nitrogenifigens DSM 19370 TaxID=983920 RepID=F1Z3H7_9SPHN|nr:ATP-binding protein [Novosphingobium nitrogenifigens]EGD60791.1 periplasmic sensor signal transduction histidine kinase [Novosphingobium nitrogenifigens DSM 19370]